MADERVHAYADDALGEHDAVALAALVRAGEVGPAELAAAAAARAERVDAALAPVAFAAYGRPHGPEGSTKGGSAKDAPLYGVPSYLKDNTDLRGMPTGQGSAAYRARPARRSAGFAEQFLGTGLGVLGKTRLPEFGLNASTEFASARPVRNPWRTSHSRAPPRAARPPWSPRASSRSRTPTTAAARSGSRPPAAGWSDSSPPGAGWCPTPRAAGCRLTW